jgi:hypothetical protein
VSDLTLAVAAILAGIALGIPILLLFPSSGRTRCWRCRVWMLPLRQRIRKFPLLPIGSCEGCNVWCLALGPRTKRQK